MIVSNEIDESVRKMRWNAGPEREENVLKQNALFDPMLFRDSRKKMYVVEGANTHLDKLALNV